VWMSVHDGLGASMRWRARPTLGGGKDYGPGGHSSEFSGA